MIALTPAHLELSPEGIPWSATYGDIYHSASGALEQAEHVFLHGNDLPQRWQGRDSFVIVETGFGLGHNFLATWAAWRTDPARSAHLHFISVEKHPFAGADLATAHAASGVEPELSAELLAHWPVLVPGCHRLELDQGRVSLTLLFGEAESALTQIVARADAIYLDGFSPAKNPDMWSPKICRALAALSDSGTRLATWSVAVALRDNLTQVGFAVELAQGFRGKREMLQGSYRGPRTRNSTAIDKRVIVIGAGLAGTAIAERLAARGMQVELLEAQGDAAQGASGNLAGAFRPLPSLDDNYLSRITRAGFLYGLQHLAMLAAAQHEVLWEPCGVLHLARNADQEGKQRAVVDALQWPSEFLRWVDAASATRKAGHTASFGGWWFPQGGWIQPASLCNANLAQASAHVTLRTSINVARLQRDATLWQALDAEGNIIASAPQLVLANAYDARRLADAEWLPLRAARGQVSHLPMAQLAPLGVVVCGQGYITPGIGGHAALGASFVVDDFDLSLREAEHTENLAKIEHMLPGFSNNQAADDLTGRVGLRAIALDRLPMVGQLPAVLQGDGYNLDTLPRQEGLWVITGFGARGLVWSSLCGELLAAQMCHEPPPLERDLVAAMDPARFIISPPKTLRFPEE